VGVTCNSTAGTVASGTWTTGAGGIKCLAATSAGSDTKATITIASSGAMTCAFT
jgi:hypothetical protein